MVVFLFALVLMQFPGLFGTRLLSQLVTLSLEVSGALRSGVGKSPRGGGTAVALRAALLAFHVGS